MAGWRARTGAAWRGSSTLDGAQLVLNHSKRSALCGPGCSQPADITEREGERERGREGVIVIEWSEKDREHVREQEREERG